ncbi:MAG TPA: hypothetical protein VHI52_10640, partial [Verrucomicrobiae bacterium]|nr:hypothetical protein [Verrucomicrobiae bacterium]
MLNRLTIILGFAVAGIPICSAQNADLHETMPPQRGVVPYGEYSIDKLETINLMTGSLGYHFPLGQLGPEPGGFSVPFSLTYNSDLYDVQYDPNDDPDQHVPTLVTSGVGGWRYSFRYEIGLDSIEGDCFTSAPLFKAFLITPDGASHPLRRSDTGDDPSRPPGYALHAPNNDGGCSGNGPYDSYTFYYTTDGSYIRVIFHGHGIGNGWDWTAWFPDGKKVLGDTANGTTQIWDANGNHVDIGGVAPDCFTDVGQCGVGWYPTTAAQTILSDPYGRAITISHVLAGDGSVAQDIIRQPGYGSGTLETTVNLVTQTLGGYYHRYADTLPSDP